MKAKLINLTPHDINVVGEKGKVTTIKASGSIARCKQKDEMFATLNGIPLVNTTFTDIEGLPHQTLGVYYIVSALIKNAAPERTDLLSPNDMVRDDQGRVIGCRSLSA